MINIVIDNQPLEVKEGTTILEAARSIDIDIPTLCYLKLEHLGVENRPAGCRICVVEVEKARTLAPACATACTEGMVIHTNTPRVLNSRTTILRLILSDHPKDCLSCAQSGDCELQNLAIRFGIRHIPEQQYGEMSHHKTDRSPAIIRNMDKCVLCRRCETMCSKVQSVSALGAVNRGFMSVIAPAFEDSLIDTVCTYCGQCVAVCPTGALTEYDYTMNVIRDLANPAKTVIVQTAPAVRAALGEEFDMNAGELVTGQMVTALRKLGFDYVFDTNFAADLTIMEEASELIDRVKRFTAGDPAAKLPMLTSCCPAWINFIESNYPDMLDVPSSARSPQQMFGAIAKTYFAEKIGVKREDLIVVSIMPCLAKKYESGREEFKVDGNPDVDYSLTTRELASLIKQANIDFMSLKSSQFDSPMGESSGAAAIFGTTGGVIEAAVRTGYEWLTGEELKKVDFQELRGWEGLRVANIKVSDSLTLNIGITHGLGNARKMLNAIKAGELSLHAIEIMACPGGCIGGGGQPFHHGHEDVLLKRREAIYKEDRNKECRLSHKNPDIIKLYKEFLGEPLHGKSHELLHTKYNRKKSNNS